MGHFQIELFDSARSHRPGWLTCCGGILFVPKNWQPLEPTKKLEWNTLVPSEIAISVSIRAGQDPRTENDD